MKIKTFVLFFCDTNPLKQRLKHSFKYVKNIEKGGKLLPAHILPFHPSHSVAQANLDSLASWCWLTGVCHCARLRALPETPVSAVIHGCFGLLAVGLGAKPSSF